MTERPHTPSFRLDGRRAIVTGAGRGLGQAAALALADAGAHVICVARTQSDLDKVVEEIMRSGGSAEAVTFDVNDIAAMQAAISNLPATHILVNNAGTNRPAEILDVRLEDYDAIMDLNVRAAFFVAQAVAKNMFRDKVGGSIINMSSQMGHVGGPKRAVYCASKHAMEGFTKVMAAEWAPFGIRANTICPTFIETPLTRPFFADKTFRTMVEDKILLGRLGNLEDLMGAIVFLASDASALITGAPLMLDGGWTAT